MLNFDGDGHVYTQANYGQIHGITIQADGKILL